MCAEETALARVVAAFAAPRDALEAIVQDFSEQMTRGLGGGPSSLRMLQTFTEQPSGRERGRVVVVDWGGTHGRAGIVDLVGGGEVHVVAENVFDFSESDKHGTAARVFDVIAGAVDRISGGVPAGTHPVGFAYSYPAWVERIDRAVALPLTKGWSVSGLEGRDVAALLNAALERRGLGRLTVSAVANDTVATLMLQSYRARGRDAAARPAEVGLILGTGTNLAADLGPAGIRNLESGNFDGVAPVETRHDLALDRELSEPKPGAQRFEKMVSGYYLGEIVRRVLEDLARTTPRFRWVPAPAFGTPFGLESAHLSRIEADRSTDLDGVEVLLGQLGVSSTPAERRELQVLSHAVVRRAARLVAAGLLGVLRFLDAGGAAGRTIAVDGSLWAGYPGFEGMVRETMVELVGAERMELIETVFLKDSTRAGAAVIAAVAAQRRRT
jgi:hexokinase